MLDKFNFYNTLFIFVFLIQFSQSNCMKLNKIIFVKKILKTVLEKNKSDLKKFSVIKNFCTLKNDSNKNFNNLSLEFKKLSSIEQEKFLKSINKTEIIREEKNKTICDNINDVAEGTAMGLVYIIGSTIFIGIPCTIIAVPIFIVIEGIRVILFGT